LLLVVKSLFDVLIVAVLGVVVVPYSLDAYSSASDSLADSTSGESAIV